MQKYTSLSTIRITEPKMGSVKGMVWNQSQNMFCKSSKAQRAQLLLVTSLLPMAPTQSYIWRSSFIVQRIRVPRDSSSSSLSTSFSSSSPLGHISGEHPWPCICCWVMLSMRMWIHTPWFLLCSLRSCFPPSRASPCTFPSLNSATQYILHLLGA